MNLRLISTCWLLILVGVFESLSSQAEGASVISKITSLDACDGWEVMTLSQNGALTGTIQNGDNKHIVLHTPESGSWAFLAKTLRPENVSGRKLRLTALVRTNTTQARFAITENFIWGKGWGGDYRVNFPTSTWQWQRVVVEYERKYQDQLFSVAVGLDYNMPDSFMEVAEVVLECGDELPPVSESLVLPNDKLDPSVSKIWVKRTAKVRGLIAGIRDQSGSLTEEVKKELAGQQAMLLKIERLTKTPKAIDVPEALLIEKFLDQAQMLQHSVEVVNSMYKFDQHTVLSLQRKSPRSLVMASNERESRVILFRNNSSGSEIYQVAVEGDITSAVEVRHLVEIGGFPDMARICSLDDIIKIGSHETIGLLVTIDSRKLSPGEYTARVILKPLSGNSPKVPVSIPVKVCPVVLAEEFPVAVYCYDYDSILNPVWRDFCLDLHVNTFTFNRLPVSPNVDFSDLIKGVTLLKQRMGTKKFQLQLEPGFIRAAGSWKPEFGTWLNALVKTTQQLGLSYDDWYLHVYDEDLSPGFLAAAKAIKNHNPKIRIFSDWIVEDPKVIEQFSPYVDLWSPPMLNLNLPQYQASLEIMRKSGHPIYTYRCDPLPSQPLWEYRKQAWLVFRYDLKGGSFWTIKPMGLEQSFFGNYQDSKGLPVPSRRFLQWRDGWEDYLLLDLVQKKAKNNSELKMILDGVVKKISSETDDQKMGEVLEMGRLHLLEQLIK